MPRKRDRNGKEIRSKKQASGHKKRMNSATKGTGKKFAYVFTLNNYTWEEEFNIAAAVDAYPDDIIYLDYGKEVGESGTPHLQGQIEMNKESM